MSLDMDDDRKIAYFSMEVALEAGMPTYSGGLGVLAGDTIRSAADLKVPMVAVTLIHHKGYFRQRLELDGRQVEEPVEWIVNNFLQPMPQRAAVTIEGRAVQIRAWKYEVSGAGGFKVPVYFLDADLPENSEWERTLTHFLYGGDQHYRLCQEAILGLGGVKILRALGYKTIERFHMNEGHSSLLTLDLLDEVARAAGRGSITHDDVETVRKKCVFTTHTPVPAGHDQNFSFRYALAIPKQKVWEAHTRAKERVIQHVNRATGVGMDRDILTIGFARRAATYKRADLLFQDTERLKRVASKSGPLQIIYPGKAHPLDQGGKDLIKKIFADSELLKNEIKILYLENYDLELGKMLTAGVDVWLNTPQPPLEASGTSGMKAALNGIPSFSILDGWWIEGCIEGITGWSIGENTKRTEESHDRSEDASSLYEKLENTILPLFYRDRDRFVEVMLHCIALNGSFFNTQRMLQQYVTNAYFV